MSEGSPTEEFGPYLVYEQLGVGGMAQVHRAIAKRSDVRRPVALKRMLSHIASSEDMVKSFVREARLASYLRHQNVAQTYDLGRVGEIYFIVMELITGRNLREVLKHCGRTTGPMPVQIALNILNQICDALDYAHNLCDETGEPLGIIHRDVSPSNVIVSETGIVKLIDFGIAKVSRAGMQTMSGTLKGKFAYMAPEYIAGQIDARADLFAIGVIAHELLTNRPLFSGRDDIDTLSRVRDMHIAPPSHKNPRVPPEIDDIVMTALARDPDRRWQHATALRTALTTLTKRLDLVASNAQVVEWLDWAFLHTGRVPQRGDRSDNDTETDGQPINDDPSISIEPCTVQLLSINQKITLVTPHGDPAPSGAMPAGTPDHMPAQRPRSSPISEGSRPEVTVRGNALRPRAPTGPVAGPVAAPVARSSSRIALRPVAPTVGSPSGPSVPSLPTPPGGRPSSTVLGTSAPPVRAARVSSPPAIHPNAVPISAALAAHLSAAQALTSAAGAPPPVRSAADLADPGDPAANLTPFAAPRAHAPTAGPPQSYDAMRSAVSQHELAQRGSAAPGAATAVRRSSRVLAVVLVVLAAAIAAITVYFVLPLLT